MTYRPILPRIMRRIWRCLTQPDRPEPTPAQRPDTFEQCVDYIVHTDRAGTKTEWLRIHVDIDSDHRLCATWPVTELHLTQEVRDDCA